MFYGTNQNGVLGPNFPDVESPFTLVNDNYYLAGVTALSMRLGGLYRQYFGGYNASMGMFTANIFFKGVPDTVTIDDYLPVWTSTKSLVFA